MGSTKPPPGSGSARRLLIVACDFDENASPQGLRWISLSRELVVLGWDVDVLTWRTLRLKPASTPARIHSVPAGPYARLLERLRRRRRRVTGDVAHVSTQAAEEGRESRATATLNWKGRLERCLQTVASWLVYPDLRREGLPSLRIGLVRLIESNHYAAAILSHEPPFALELIDELVSRGLPVVADLGDPVCAPYTPRRWRRRALRLESKICALASAVVVTSMSTRRLLHDRHGEMPGSSAVITQGFQPSDDPAGAAVGPHTGERMSLVYTGRFYRFRNPLPVFEAVAATDGIVLDLAVPEMPDWLGGDWRSAAHIRMQDHLSHAESLHLQRSADVLLVIGNDDPTQTPGKLYEYFGACRPILYVARHPADPAAELILRLRRGRVAMSDCRDIAAALTELRALHLEGSLPGAFDLSSESVAEYAWPSLALRYSEMLARLTPPNP